MELRLLLHRLYTAPAYFGKELSLHSKEQIQLRIRAAEATPDVLLVLFTDPSWWVENTWKGKAHIRNVWD